MQEEYVLAILLVCIIMQATRRPTMIRLWFRHELAIAPILALDTWLNKAPLLQERFNGVHISCIHSFGLQSIPVDIASQKPLLYSIASRVTLLWTAFTSYGVLYTFQLQ